MKAEPNNEPGKKRYQKLYPPRELNRAVETVSGKRGRMGGQEDLVG
jgi:hypothetical protein